MAEETTIIREIYLGPFHGSSTIDEVIRMLRGLIPTKKIHLTLMFMNIEGFRFSETVELRELAFEKKSQIHRLDVYNELNFFVPFLLADNGETKHFTYWELSAINMQLDQVTGLSNAIRTNNIESFNFTGCCKSSEVFQPVWDALLTTNVQNIKLSLEFSKNNEERSGSNKFDFSNISTNTSLKELKLEITLYGTNLFDSIKGNTTIEILEIRSQQGDANFNISEKKAFIEMLFQNTTLIHVELRDGNFYHILQEEIDIHTTLNRMWKRLIIVRRKERIAAAATVAIYTPTTTVAFTTATDGDVTVGRRKQKNNVDEVEKNKKIEEETKMRKKKREMNLWLKTFEKKAVLCNELIYLFLTENAGDRYNNNETSSIVFGEQRKKKRKKKCLSSR